MRLNVLKRKATAIIITTVLALGIVAFVSPAVVFASTSAATANDRFSNWLEELIDSIMGEVERGIEQGLEQAEHELERELRQLERELLRILRDVERRADRLQDDRTDREADREADNDTNANWSWGGHYFSQGDLAILEGRVFAEPRVTELTFDDVTALDLNIWNDAIQIVTGGDILTIRYYEWMEDHYTLTVTGGTLTLQHNLPRGDSYLFGRGYNLLRHYLNARRNIWNNNVIRITVPQGFSLDSIDVNSTNSSLAIDGITVTGTVSHRTTNGSIAIQNSSFGGEISVRSTNGSIAVDGSEFSATATLRTSNGSVTVRNNAFAAQTEITTTNGSLAATGNTFSNTGAVIMRTTNGNAVLGLTRPASNYDLHLSASARRMHHNGRVIERDALRNSNSRYRVEFSTANGNLHVNDR